MLQLSTSVMDDILNSLTPQERKFFKLLLDGNDHTLQELQALRWDDRSELSGLRVLLFYLRNKLEPFYLQIMQCPRHKTVRMLHSPRQVSFPIT